MNSSIESYSAKLKSKIKNIESANKNDIQTLILTKKDIIDLLDDVGAINDDEKIVLNDKTLDNDKFVIIDNFKNRQQLLLNMENDLKYLKEIMSDLKDLVLLQETDINKIEYNINYTKDQITETELDLLISQDHYNSYNKLKLLLFIPLALLSSLLYFKK